MQRWTVASGVMIRGCCATAVTPAGQEWRQMWKASGAKWRWWAWWCLGCLSSSTSLGASPFAMHRGRTSSNAMRSSIVPGAGGVATGFGAPHIRSPPKAILQPLCHTCHFICRLLLSCWCFYAREREHTVQGTQSLIRFRVFSASAFLKGTSDSIHFQRFTSLEGLSEFCSVVVHVK